MDKSILNLDFPTGYSVTIGSLVAQMRLTKYVISLKVTQLSIGELDFVPAGYEYTIGTLLKHMILVEKLYQTIIFRGRYLNESEIEEWTGSLPGAFIIERNLGKPIDYYLSTWDEVRNFTEEKLREYEDVWLSKYPIGYLKSYGNNYYCLFHIMEDQLCHYGQIKTLMSLQKKQHVNS